MIKISFDKLVLYTAVTISLVFTPFNFDAMIIPKMTVLFVAALFLLPALLLNFRQFIANRKVFIILGISIILILNMTLVMFLSQAPFEQEFYGRTGRGLGFITYTSTIIILLVTIKYFTIKNSYDINKLLVLTVILSSVYAIMQHFNLDIFNWTSRTNGIIGTLGNPNFQSSFVAMAFIPTLVYFYSHSRKYLFLTPSLLVLISTLYFTNSTQGYVAVLAAVSIYLIAFTRYKNRILFYSSGIFFLIIGVIAIAGMLNKGPLSYYLYKVSVQSRGDFWRSAFHAANSNPLTGVGVDSFGDSYLIYRDQVAVDHTFAEMTDNAHNYFLEYAATNGYLFATLNLLILIISLYSFYSIQRKLGRFDPFFVGIFCAWFVFQIQSIISPGTIALIVWNTVISGFAIGSNLKLGSDQLPKPMETIYRTFKIKVIASLLSLIAFLFMFPLVNSDRILKNGAAAGDGLAVMQALKMFPESSVKYNLFGQEFLKSNLNKEALDIARSAINFNSNAASAWALILVNPESSTEEKLRAKAEIIRLDPLNTEVFSFRLE